MGEELPLLIENFMEHVSWTVSHAQTEIQRPHMEEIFTKSKNYGQVYRYCPLPGSLSIAVDHDLLELFQCKRALRLILRLFQRSKEVSSNNMILPFF